MIKQRQWLLGNLDNLDNGSNHNKELHSNDLRLLINKNGCKKKKEPTRNNLFSRMNQVLQQHMLIKSLSKEIASGRVGPNAPKGLGGLIIKSKGKSLVDNHSKGSWNLIEGNPIPRRPTTTTRLSSFIKVNSQLGYYFLNKRL